MNQYIILEEGINKGIEFLNRNVKSVQEKKQLDSNVDKFNKVNSEFQENWNDEYWRCYEMIKDGKMKSKGYKPDLPMRVAHLQEIASTLNKNINDDGKDEEIVLEKKDEPVNEKENKKINPDPIQSKCCACRIF